MTWRCDMKNFLCLLLGLILVMTVFAGCNIIPEDNADSNNDDTLENTESITDTDAQNTGSENALVETPAEYFLYQPLSDGTIEISYIGQNNCVIVPERIDGMMVSTIAEKGFQSARSFLKNVTLPNTIKEIKRNAFDDCTLLESINIPKSVFQIGSCAFRGCTSLTTISIHSDCLTETSSEIFALSGLREVTLGEGITCIPKYCFVETHISQIELPTTVKTIGDNAFSACNLEKISLNNGLVTIGHKAFSANVSLKEITIPKTVINITEMAFSGCSALNKVVFEGNAPTSYIYSDDISGIWYPVNTNYVVYYHSGADGFTFPEWNGYRTQIIQ